MRVVLSFAWYRLLLVLPLVALGLHLLYLVRWGVDIPFWDDWRQYYDNKLGSVMPKNLLAPSNDTIYAVGIFLDSVAFRLFQGHSPTYQFLSLLLVLGSLLWLIWRLLALNNTPPWLRALAFSLTLPMMQPDTYWGLHNLAYHQGLPLVFILAIVYLIQAVDVNENRWLSYGYYLALATLSALSGLTYISGAFAVMGVGVVLLFYPTYRRDGWVVVLAGLPILLAQLWVILFHQAGTHLPGLSMAYPWQWDFWVFTLGKVGRALLLRPDPQWLVVYFVLALLLVVLWGIALYKNRQNVTLMTLSVALVLYLGLVAAGRTNFRPDDMTNALAIFGHSFHSFHFFWVTLIWPFLLVAWWQYKPSRWYGVLAIIPLLWLLYTDVWQHNTYYQHAMWRKQEGIRCLNEQLATQDPTAPLTSLVLQCPTIYPEDEGQLPYNYLGQAVKNAIHRGASFTRQYPEAWR